MRSIISDVVSISRLPSVTIDLMYKSVSPVDPFYSTITNNFYNEATARHRKLFFVGQLTHGVALCPLPHQAEAYVGMIEASGRRNVKKADRLGYRFEKINYNKYLADIQDIRQSTDVRQGQLSKDFLNAEVVPCRNPVPSTSTHDYPYFGVLQEGRLVAYAGMLVAGELGMIEHIYGHAALQGDGVVPLLLVGMAEYLQKHYPVVKYYGYGSYFGASETLRRFKRKFMFQPYRVHWKL